MESNIFRDNYTFIIETIKFHVCRLKKLTVKNLSYFTKKYYFCRGKKM